MATEKSSLEASAQGARNRVRAIRFHPHTPGTILWIILLTGLAGFTVWHFDYSPALASASAAYEGHNPYAYNPAWFGQIESLITSIRDPQRVQKQRAAAPDPQPDYLLALRRAVDHIAEHPNDPDASRLAALCLSRLDFASEAEPYYTIARAKGRLTIADLQVRALGLSRGNFREQAIVALNEIVALQPDEPEALQRLAGIYYSMSQYKETLAIAERLSQSPIVSRAVAGYALIGIVHHDEHHPGLAVAANEKVLEIDPRLESLSLPVALFLADFAQDLIDIGRATDARRQLSRILRQREDPVLIDILGSAYYAEGQEDDAEHCWKRVTEIDPRIHRPWMNLGKLALRRGRLEEAVPYFEKAHSIDPGIYEPAYQLSLAYRRLGRAQESERYSKLAEALRAKNLINQRGAGLIPQ
jgi:tetratricopeptide (TPR) repeat protein